MKSTYFTIHSDKNPPPQNDCRLKSPFFLKHRFRILHFPNSTGLSQNQPAAITLHTGSPGTLLAAIASAPRDDTSSASASASSAFATRAAAPNDRVAARFGADWGRNEAQCSSSKGYDHELSDKTTSQQQQQGIVIADSVAVRRSCCGSVCGLPRSGSSGSVAEGRVGYGRVCFGLLFLRVERTEGGGGIRERIWSG
jgi:hypothetical protein